MTTHNDPHRPVFVDSFPCAFMRASRDGLRAAFPTLRSPQDRESGRAEGPDRPPLPYSAFWTGSFWWDEFPVLFALATGFTLTLEDDEEESDVDFVVAAPLWCGVVHGTDLMIWPVPSELRDALAVLDDAACAALARAWVGAIRVREPSLSHEKLDERRSTSVQELAALARAACAANEQLFIWSNT